MRHLEISLISMGIDAKTSGALDVLRSGARKVFKK